MGDSSPRIDAIQWYEGMLLGPQHFQQYTHYWHNILHKFVTFLHPFYWGIAQFSLDSVLLVSGKFRILELEGILPDGLFIKITSTDSSSPLEIDLTPYADQIRTQGPITVYLGIPQYIPNASNVTGDFPRFISTPGTPMVDDNTGENAIYIPRLIPNLTLIAGSTPHPRYVSIPVAQISIKDEAYVLSPFMPPLLKVTELSLLGEVIADILQRLRNKAAFLSENLQPSSQAVLDSSLETNYENLLKIITRKVPFLEALLTTNSTHPYELYLALLDLAGDLTTLKKGQIAPVFAPYNHNALFQTFDQVITFVLAMLDLIQENYVMIPFTKEARIFALRLLPEWWSSSYVVGLKGSSSLSPKDLSNWIQNAVIASQSFVKNVRDRRILGAARQIIEVDNTLNVSAPEGGILVSITNDSEFIKPDDVLCLFNLNDAEDTRPLELDLYVKKTAPTTTTHS